MKTLTQTAAILLLAAASTASAQVIIADDYTGDSGTTRGFILNQGANVGINFPSTRLTGTAAAGVYYTNATPTQKPDTSYYINSNKLRINNGAQSGRAMLTSGGTVPFDFSTALGIASATATKPVIYDVTISMDNNATAIQRMSFAISTQEGVNTDWDFGLQLHRAGTTAAPGTTHNVSKRINTGSSGLANQNAVIFAGGNAGAQVDFLMRVTDAGAQTDAFNSRIQVSIDGGATWAYDTLTDAALSNGFRFDDTERYFVFDIAANDAFVAYDNFSVTIVPEPSIAALGLLGLATILIRRRS